MFIYIWNKLLPAWLTQSYQWSCSHVTPGRFPVCLTALKVWAPRGRQARLLHWPYRLLGRLEPQGRRKQLWGSQQALPPGPSGTTWGSAGCQRHLSHLPLHGCSHFLSCFIALVLTHMLFCVLLLQQRLSQQSQTRCPPGPKAFLYLSEPLNTCSRCTGPDLEGPTRGEGLGGAGLFPSLMTDVGRRDLWRPNEDSLRPRLQHRNEQGF